MNAANVFLLTKILLRGMRIDVFGMLRKPLFEKFLHRYAAIKLIWIFVIFHEGEIRFVVGFKIALRSQRFADRMPCGIFPDSDEDSEWFSKISIFYLGDLAETIWQSSMLFSFLR